MGDKAESAVARGPRGPREGPEGDRAIERFLSVFDQLADPEHSRTNAALARELGCSKRRVEQIRERIQKRLDPTLQEAREVRASQLSELAKGAAYKIGLALNEKTMDQLRAEPIRELGLTFNYMVDKYLLLEGKPTQRLSIEELGSLDELAKELLQEARRRGMEYVIDPETQQVRAETPSPRVVAEIRGQEVIESPTYRRVLQPAPQEPDPT